MAEQNGESCYHPPKSSLIKNKRTTLERIEKYISKDHFTDVNLYGKLYPETVPITDITHVAIEGNWEDVTFDQVVDMEFLPAKVGDDFGPSWSTHWFKLSLKVPHDWTDDYVCLRWSSQSEAMIYDDKGHCLQGLTTGTSHQLRTDYCISEKWKRCDLPLTFYIEMSCSRMFGLGKGGMINPPNPDERFKLEKAEIAVQNVMVYGLIMDLKCLHSIANNMPDDHRGYLAMYAGNEMVNLITADHYPQAKQIAKEFFSQRGGDLSNTLALIGNCHIDSAWLWRYTETKRKCARSWASTLALMDTYKDMVFAVSQAQQLFWVKKHYPELYQRICVKVKEGRIIPVGSTWVEMDGLLPSGESFMRQFLYGQKFFKEEFGAYCKEFWLPDTFGYSGQIPQICKQFNIERFLTQKLSWNLVNKFPHHTFHWEGIDGSSVLAHFPPGDSYEMSINTEEIIRSEKNLQDKGRTNVSAFLYGYGDGGGGPTKDMLERAARLANVDGLPKLKHMSPDSFFTVLEGQRDNLCKWVGELYLELHNGTYTSQALVKEQNRRCELMARTTEMVLAVSSMTQKQTRDLLPSYRDRCEKAWKMILLNQFHDVLPGSSIGEVYADAQTLYGDAIKELDDVRKYVFGCPPVSAMCTFTKYWRALNTLPWTVSAVFSNVGPWTLPRCLVTNPLSCGPPSFFSPPVNVTVERRGKQFVLKNQYMEAVISPYGEVVVLDGIFSNENTVRRKGNVLALYDDIPLFWDAWDVMDYHLETRTILNDHNNEHRITPVSIIVDNPLVVRLEWQCKISDKSSLRQVIELTACSKYLTFDTTVDWYENRKFLKVEFDTQLLCRNALYDIQFGHVERPTHRNTSWDTARFEVCCHKWASLSEHGKGVAILNDGKYGMNAIDGKLSLSLLRSPKAPDDKCDMSSHAFKYAVMPHSGNIHESRVIQAAYEFNIPIQLIETDFPFTNLSWLEIENTDCIMLEAMKLAEDSVTSVIFRLYEAQGGSAKSSIRLPIPYGAASAFECDGMEMPRTELPLQEHVDQMTVIPLQFRPFEIKTIRVNFN